MPNKVKSFGRCRRLGRFKLEAFEVQARTPAVTRIMGACAILRCELLACEDRFEYFASSRYFKPLDDGEQVPVYGWVFHDDGSLEVVNFRAARYQWRGLHVTIPRGLPAVALDTDLIDVMRKPLPGE